MRTRGALLVGTALAALGLVTSACQQTAPYAAIVNGSRISQDSLFKELRGLSANKVFAEEYNSSAQQASRAPMMTTDTAKPTFSQSFVAVVLGTDVQAAVIHSEVVRRKIQPPASAVTAPANVTAAGQQFGNDPNSGKPIFAGFDPWLRHDFEARQADLNALRQALGTQPIDDAAIAKYYQDNLSTFISNECVSHILVKTKDLADSIRAQIVAGADFAALAKANSIDTASGAKGGDLGCGAAGQYVAPFEQAADTIPIGQLSDVVQTQYGFHIIKVTARTVTPLNDQTKAQIKSQLQQQADNPLNGFLQTAAKTLKVDVNPAFGSWDSQQLVVVPPKAPGASSGLPTTVPAAAQPGAVSPPATDQNGNPVGASQSPPATDQNGNPVGASQAPATPTSTP